jgi:hypothetical protein
MSTSNEKCATLCVYVRMNRFDVLKAVTITMAAFEASHRVVYWKITRDS